MKILLITLILSLPAGCETSSEVKGCPGGWVEFTCKYPKTNGIYKITKVLPKNKKEQSLTQEAYVSTQNDTWENKSRCISLYRDTKKKNLRMVIKQLTGSDEGEYKCSFQEETIVEVELEKEKDGCQKPLTQIAYKTAKTTITCTNPGDEFEAGVNFFCKESRSACEDILSNSSEQNGTYTLSSTENGFNVTISNLTSEHNGTYWCGVETSYRTAVKKIDLLVKGIRRFTKSPPAGQNFSYWCTYNNGPIKKFICKGDDPSLCEPLANTENKKKAEKFHMKDDRKNENITITVRNVTINDTGTYWCGAENTDPSRTRTFYHMFQMNVASSSSSHLTSTVSPVTPSNEGPDGPRVFTIVAGCTAVLLLVLLILVLAYKRFVSTKNRRNGEAQNSKEDCYVYEEIQEHSKQPNSETAPNSIYVTANFPTNPSAFLHYSTISVQKNLNKPDDQAVKMHPSACEYVTVNIQNKAQSSSVEPLWSTVEKNQQL